MRRLKQVVCCLAVSVLLGTATLSVAGPGDPLISIPNPVPHLYDGFGFAVAGTADKLLVGAPATITGQIGIGAAYAFDASGNLSQSLQKPVEDANDGFGYSVAIGNGNLLVGAPYANIGGVSTGAAYLFGSNGAPLWTFTNPTPDYGDGFGRAVAVNGTKVLIGALCDDTAVGDGGAVYLFDAASGSLLQTFTSPAHVPVENFGSSVAWVGDRILVGASQEALEPWHAFGAAYLFDQSGNILQSFHSPTLAAGEYFGTSVAAIGNNVLVGAPGWKNYRSTTTAGAAYLFDGTTGELLHTFADPAGQAGDLFGVSVAALGENILIGAAYDNTVAMYAGAAYVFDSTGNLLRTYYDPAGQYTDRFGYSVAAVGNDALIGAPGLSRPSGYAVGAVYLFQGVSEPATIPEPSTFIIWSLLGTLAIGVGWWRRRKGA